MRRQNVSDEEIARVYNEAARIGEPPARAVATAFCVSRRTAGLWVKQARDAGTYFETSHRNARAVAVARALGIPYETLVSAVIDHADGDLRVQG